MVTQPKINTLGLFEKRIEGDDALMELARHRFREAGMGAEMHAGTPAHLERLLQFRPSEDAAVTVHLPRDFNVADENSRARILELARQFAGRIQGMVVHDHAALTEHHADYVEVAWRLDDQLEKIPQSPLLFVEYAVGMEPASYFGLFSSIPDLDRIGACIDIGHIGIRQARAAFAVNHHGEDVCALKSQAARLATLMPEVDAAVAVGAAAALEAVDTIAALKKPVHFHLHDGHPLSAASPFGVADHLSFETIIPLPFDYQGRSAVAPMFGPAGLARIVDRAVRSLGPRGVSFTLEIHPAFDRAALGKAAHFFEHWIDKTNAEMMNHWLDVLTRNHELLRQAIDAALVPRSGDDSTETRESRLGNQGTESDYPGDGRP